MHSGTMLCCAAHRARVAAARPTLLVRTAQHQHMASAVSTLLVSEELCLAQTLHNQAPHSTQQHDTTAGRNRPGPCHRHESVHRVTPCIPANHTCRTPSAHESLNLEPRSPLLAILGFSSPHSQGRPASHREPAARMPQACSPRRQSPFNLWPTNNQTRQSLTELTAVKHSRTAACTQDTPERFALHQAV